MKYYTYKDIPVWKLSHQFVLHIYGLSDNFPKHEIYGLTSQMRRSAVSVCSNIAEGVSRKGSKELIQFLSTARASLVECEYQLFLSKDLRYIKVDEYENLYKNYDEIHKQLSSWIISIKNKKGRE